MKPKGQTHPQRDLPKKTAVKRKAAIGSHGNMTSYREYWSAEKASPTVLEGFPKLNKTGKRTGKGLKPKMAAFNKTKEQN